MKIFRCLIGVTLLFCISFTTFFGYKKINEVKVSQTENFKGIITVWQIDAFDGGVGSRRQFLLKVAKRFEKENQGVLLMVISHTKESASLALRSGETPDMISYGVGFNMSSPIKLNLSGSTSGGKLKNTYYAVEWCRGGYVLLENLDIDEKKVNKCVISTYENNLSSLAYYYSGVQMNSVEFMPKNDAIGEFVNGKVKYLFCTQREIYRLKNRNMNLKITPIEGYNDLYQYISICTTDRNRLNLCNKFIEKLICPEVQKQLNSIGLFSTYCKVDYPDDVFNDIQNCSYNKTISAFIGEENFNELLSLSKKMILGDKDSENKIKNMII